MSTSEDHSRAVPSTLAQSSSSSSSSGSSDADTDSSTTDVDSDGCCCREQQIRPLMDVHPLQSRWTLWFFKNDPGRPWSENQHPVANFATVEDFWSLVRHVKPPSQLPDGCDYSVFRAGCRPMWEDPANRRGGRWLVCLGRRGGGSSADLLDSAWTDALLMVVGEAALPDARLSGEVSGLIVQVRAKRCRLCLWTRTASDRDACAALGRAFKAALRLSRPAGSSDRTGRGAAAAAVFAYETHADQLANRAPRAKYFL